MTLSAQLIVNDSYVHKAFNDAIAVAGEGISTEKLGLVVLAFDHSLRQSSQTPQISQALKIPFSDNEYIAFQGDLPIYPASVMKLFLLYALFYASERKDIYLNEEDIRAAKAMIRISSNEATVYLLGRLTGAEDGSILPPDEMQAWSEKRRRLQSFFDSLNIPEFKNIHLQHATYEDSPYGRAKLIRTEDNANKLTALSGARLLYDIMTGYNISSHSAKSMQELLHRDWQRDLIEENNKNNKNDFLEGNQVEGFLSEYYGNDIKVWSKSGHTSWTRHDLLYAEYGDNYNNNKKVASFIISIMLEGKGPSNNNKFLPHFGKNIAEYVKNKFVDGL